MFFSELATIFESIEQTRSRLEMTEILAKLFSQTSSDEIGRVCYLLQGRVVPLYEPLEFGMADKFVIKAIALASEMDTEDVVKIFRKSGDLGTAAQSIRDEESGKKEQGRKLSTIEVFDVLKEIAQIGGEGSQEKKITKLSNLLKDVDPLSVRYIIRIPLGKMRLGFSDMTILDSLSWMLNGDKSLREPLETAFNVRPDIGLIAQRVKEEGMKGLERITTVVGAPILSALCQRLPTADEMIEKMGEVSVEPKYDGVRVQIHWSKKGIQGVVVSNVKTYSRNLENTTVMFPELQQMGDQIDGESVILDSEAVGVDPATGKILPFQETTTRKRKHDIAEAVKNVPLRFYVFDILYKNGEQLLSVPLNKRRKLLEQTIQKGELFVISPHIVTSDPSEIREYHAKQLKAGLEGVVIKKWDGFYESGRRSFNWVKFKESEGKTGKLKDTIDAVVMGYYHGEGKRNGFGIGAFLVGVRKGDSMVTISKIGTGVSDEQWKELFTRFKAIKEGEKPKEYEDVSKLLVPDVWLRPQIVVEVAGDDLTKSPNHGTGYAIRFPRLIRVREDKSPNEATSVTEVEEMFKTQGS